MEQATLEAPDISCDHCIMTIEKAVTKLPGVRFVSGDPGDQDRHVEFDPAQAELSAIQQAMEEEGYPVASVGEGLRPAQPARRASASSSSLLVAITACGGSGEGEETPTPLLHPVSSRLHPHSTPSRRSSTR